MEEALEERAASGEEVFFSSHARARRQGISR
jgi:hypothetical protein